MSFLIFPFTQLRMLYENWGRCIWTENTIFTVWLFNGVVIFSLLLDILEKYIRTKKTSHEGNGATHILKRKHMYTMILIFFVDFFRLLLHAFMYVHTIFIHTFCIYINLLLRRFVTFICQQ